MENQEYISKEYISKEYYCKDCNEDFDKPLVIELYRDEVKRCPCCHSYNIK